MIKYIFFLIIPLLIIFPNAYANTLDLETTTWGEIRDADSSDSCEVSPVLTNTIDGALASVFTLNHASIDCMRSYFEFDISSIDPSWNLTSASFVFEVTAINSPLNTDYRNMDFQPSTQATSSLMQDIANGTVYVSNDPTSTTVGTNKVLDLGNTFLTDLETARDAAQTWYGIGIKLNDESGAGTVDHDTDFGTISGTPNPTLRITYESVDAVTDLSASDIRTLSVDLTWSTPTLYGGNTIQGYMINTTTPHNSNVATQLVNSTNSTITTATISDLIGSTPYSFRIGIWLDVGGGNFTGGNVLNITTDVDQTATFSAGTFNITAVGEDVRDFKFSRNDTSPTSITLDITYTNTIDPSCDFYYKFAMINKTYNSPAFVAVNANEDKATFIFNDVDNEIIDVNCVDQNDGNVTGQYLITQTSFMILEQIQGFRAGDFGTDGNFGAIDFIALTAIILSMIGLNRVNESVGIIFGIFMIGALSVFQIIPWQSTLTASLALIAMWAITTTRKN